MNSIFKNALVRGAVVLFMALSVCAPSVMAQTSGGLKIPDGTVGAGQVPGTNFAVPTPNDPDGLLTPPEGDLSVKLLGAIFGGDPTKSNSMLPIIGSSMNVYNIICGIVAAWLVAMTAVAGVMHTISDAKFMGRKWNPSWIAIRYSFGALMLVPTASGFSNGQLFGLWVIDMGAGAASSVWKVAANDFGARMGDVSALRSAQLDEVKDAMRTILAAEMCTVMNNRAAESNGGDGKERFGHVVETNRDGAISRVAWGRLSADGTTVDSTCGQALKPGVAYDDRSAIGKLAGAVSDIFVRNAEYREQIGRPGGVAQTDATKTAMTTLSEFARNKGVPRLVVVGEPGAQEVVIDPQFVQPTKAEVEAVLEQAGVAYTQAIGRAVNEALSRSELKQNMLSGMLDSANSQGWILAGAWYFQAAKINSEISSFISSISDLTWLTNSANLVAVINSMDSHLVEGMKSASKNVADASRPPTIPDIGGTGAPSRLNGVMAKLATSVSTAIGQGVGFNPDDPRHPLLQIQSSGQGLLVAGSAIMMSSKIAELLAAGFNASAAGVAANLVSGVPTAILEAVKWASAKAETVAIALFMLGFLKAILIPLWPIIKWLKQVIVFLVTVCEVMAAIPMWVAFHMIPEGDGFASERTRTGYGILMEAALRPILLVIGLIFSFMIMWPAVYFTSMILELTFLTVNTESSFTLIFTVIGQAIVYAIITLYVVDWSCDVIDGLSGRVMSWINISPGHNNNDVEQKVYAAFGAVRGQMGTMLAAKRALKTDKKLGPGGGGEGDPTARSQSGGGASGLDR